MSIPHTRQTPPPRLSVQAALLWIALIFLVMALAVAFGNHTPHRFSRWRNVSRRTHRAQ